MCSATQAKKIDNILTQEEGSYYEPFKVYDEAEEDDDLSAYARYTQDWNTREDDEHDEEIFYRQDDE